VTTPARFLFFGNIFPAGYLGIGAPFHEVWLHLDEAPSLRLGLGFLDLDVAGLKVDLLPIEPDDFRRPDPGERAERKIGENIVAALERLQLHRGISHGDRLT
jgi:hypothetical protein